MPREVIGHTREDFDAICGAMAAQLAALFAFLQPSQEQPQRTDRYADPTYWLYGEAKTAEAGGEPDFRTSKERKQEITTRKMQQ